MVLRVRDVRIGCTNAAGSPSCLYKASKKQKPSIVNVLDVPVSLRTVANSATIFDKAALSAGFDIATRSRQSRSDFLTRTGVCGGTFFGCSGVRRPPVDSPVRSMTSSSSSVSLGFATCVSGVGTFVWSARAGRLLSWSLARSCSTFSISELVHAGRVGAVRGTGFAYDGYSFIRDEIASWNKPYLLGRRWPNKLVNVRKPVLMSKCLELVHPVLIIRRLGEFQSSAIPKEFFKL